MDLTVPKFVAYIAAWFAIMGGIWALFDRAETVLRVDIKSKLSVWLQNSNKSSDWPPIFISLFDRVFGKKHMWIERFARSCFASSCMMVIVGLIYLNFNVSDSTTLNDLKISDIAGFIVLGSVLNFFPDYFSLLQTRFILGLMRDKNVIVKFGFAIIDLSLTFLIFFLAPISFAALFYYPDQDYPNLNMVISMLKSLLFWELDNSFSSFGIFLYTTFFTSIWVWLFLISSLIAKTLNYIGIAYSASGRFFDIQEKPLRTMGFISMLLVTFIFMLIPFF